MAGYQIFSAFLDQYSAGDSICECDNYSMTQCCFRKASEEGVVW